MSLMCRVLQRPRPPESQQGKKWDLQKAGEPEKCSVTQDASPKALGFAFCEGPVRSTTSPLWTTPFPAPCITKEQSPLCWGALPPLPLPLPGIQIPTCSTRAAFKRRGRLGPGGTGLRLCFGQLWKSHFASLGLVPHLYDKNMNPCPTPYMTT